VLHAKAHSPPDGHLISATAPSPDSSTACAPDLLCIDEFGCMAPDRRAGDPLFPISTERGKNSRRNRISETSRD
jgi:hypothetical protein